MNLSRYARCENCKDAARPGCRIARAAMDEVGEVLARHTTEALTHGVKLPAVDFRVEMPCWYSARKARREGTA